MSKSSELAQLNERWEPTLKFPVAPDFASRPPHLDPELMLVRCEQGMPFRNARPGEAARRLSKKCSVEFKL